MNKLTEKQRQFVSNKVAGVANRDAAIAAGYAVAGASVAADKLMRNPAVRNAIKAATPAVTTSGVPTMPRAHYADAMTFLQDVMNHAKLPIAMRADAAKQLLPYQHPRIGETGKKQAAKERAHAIVSAHKFQPKQPPQLRVVGGRKNTPLP